MSASYRKDVAKIAKKLGLSLQLTRGGHLRASAPSGAFVFLSQTPSHGRALAVSAAKLKRLAREEEETRA